MKVTTFKDVIEKNRNFYIKFQQGFTKKLLCDAAKSKRPQANSDFASYLNTPFNNRFKKSSSIEH